MTRVGWVFLMLVVVSLGAVLSTTRFGGGTATFAHRPAAIATVRVPPAAASGEDRSAGPLVVPVAGVPRAALRDSWGDARGQGRGHHGTDITAAGGTPVLATAAGRIEKLFQSRLGGTTLYLRSLDRRWIYYYAHLSGYAAGVREGMAVRPGQHLGYVGDTGDAGAGNYHLHFGMQRMRPEERWWQGEDVDPYPLLAGSRVSR